MSVAVVRVLVRWTGGSARQWIAERPPRSVLHKLHAFSCLWWRLLNPTHGDVEVHVVYLIRIRVAGDEAVTIRQIVELHSA